MDLKNRITVDDGICSLCEVCITVCPAHLFVLENERILARDQEHCIECGHCVAACPDEAVTHQSLNLDELVPVSVDDRISPDHLVDFLRSRRSCRTYKNTPPSRELIERLIECARFAPTGHNSQNVDIIVIQDPSLIRKLSQTAAAFFGNLAQLIEKGEPTVAHMQEFLHGFRLNYAFSLQGKDRIFRGAPVVVLFHAEKIRATNKDNCLYALYHMVLLAQSLELGSCINGYFTAAAEWVPEIPQMLNIPADHQIFGCLTLGYPVTTFLKKPSRRPARVTWK